jgi:hypothetical protein
MINVGAWPLTLVHPKSARFPNRPIEKALRWAQRNLAIEQSYAPRNRPWGTIRSSLCQDYILAIACDEPEGMEVQKGGITEILRSRETYISDDLAMTVYNSRTAVEGALKIADFRLDPGLKE